MHDDQSTTIPTFQVDRKTSAIWCVVAVGTIAFVTEVLFAIISRQPFKIGPDPAFFIAVGQLILEGKIPYVDMFDVNPPLVLYLHALPALAAKMLPIPASETFSLFVLLLFAICIALSAAILWRRRSHPEAFLFCPLLIGFALATFLFGTRLNDFGQREHLFALTYFPLFLIRWLRWSARPVSRREAILAALPVGITALLKPHFVFLVLAGEVSMFLQNLCMKRRVSPPLRVPEITVLLVSALIYGLYFCLMPQQSRHGYFDIMVPAYSLGYDAFASSTPTLLVGALLQFKYSVVLCVVALLGTHILSGRSTLLIPLAGVTTAAYLIYLWQGNAWINRAIPFFTYGYMLCSIEIAIVLYAIASHAGKLTLLANRFLAACIGLLLFWCIGQERWIQMLVSNDQQPFLLSRIGLTGTCSHFGLSPAAETILKETKQGDMVLFISPFIAPGYPCLLQINRRPASRFIHGMLIPVLSFGMKSDDPSRRAFAERLMEDVTKQYREDIELNKPKLIFVQKKLMSPFVQESKDLQKALSAYEKVEEIEGHDVYRLVAPP